MKSSLGIYTFAYRIYGINNRTQWKADKEIQDEEDYYLDTHFTWESLGKQACSHAAGGGVNDYNTHGKQLGNVYQNYKFALCPGIPASIYFFLQIH